jgi:hypothetical protein
MVVRVNAQSVAEELRTALRSAGCVTHVRNGVELSISHPLANDDKEAATEIAFFVRAWQRHAAANVELVCDGEEPT